MNGQRDCIKYISIVLSYLLVLQAGTPAFATEGGSDQTQQLQELDLNYPEDGTSGNPRFRFGSDDPESQQYLKEVQAEEARLNKLAEMIKEHEKSMKSHKGGVGVAWPVFVITAAGGGVLAGFSMDQGWYSSENSRAPMVIIATVGTFVIAAAMLGLGIASSAMYSKHKRERDKLLNELEGFPPDEEDPYDGLAW